MFFEEIDTRSMKEYIQLLAMESKEYHLLTSSAPGPDGLFGANAATGSARPAPRKRAAGA